MKKASLIAAIAALLSLTSCKYEVYDHGNRNSNYLTSLTSEIMNMTQKYPMSCVYQAFRVEEFINATPEEQKDSKYSDIKVSNDGKTFTVSRKYIISTAGTDLFGTGAEWTVNIADYEESIVTIECLGEGTFTVFGRSGYHSYYSTGKGTYADYCIELTLDGFDDNGKPVFSSEVSGEFHEKNSDFSARISDLDGMHYSWKINNVEGNLSYEMLITNSSFTVRFLENGNERDWCSIDYDNAGRTTYRCSLKN